MSGSLRTAEVIAPDSAGGFLEVQEKVQGSRTKLPWEKRQFHRLFMRYWPIRLAIRFADMWLFTGSVSVPAN